MAGPLAHGDVVPGAQRPKEVSGEGATPGPPVNEVVASRHLTASAAPQLAALRARMSINQHDKGPFGFFQDPEKAAKQVIDIPMAKKLAPKVVTPFRDVVQAVPISVVIPSKQEFVVNSRTIRSGDQFPLVVGSDTLTVRVERVRNSGVLFRNIKTGEQAEKKMEFLPAGVIRSQGGEILPAGITPTGRGTNQELVIDPADIHPTHNGRSR